MAILIHKLRKLKLKKALASILLAGFVAILGSSTFVAALGPQFNIFPISYSPAQNTDLPLLDARNITRNIGYSISQSDHDNGLIANPSDELEFSIYYHNGAANTDANVAINTLIRAFANPSIGTKTSTHTISASLGASNATTVFSSQKGGDMNVHIQGGVPQSLSLIPGTVRLFKDCGSTNCQAGGGTGLPDSIFSSGVTIGDVRGCFEFHGFVNFKMRVSADTPAEGQLQIKKEVRNVSKNTGFNDFEITADPSDTVEYRITVSALTNPVNNVSGRDVIDGKLFVSGSVTLDGSAVNNAAFFSSGVSVGTVSPNSNRVFAFSAIVAPSSQFSTGTHILPNTATAFNNALQVSDGANVRVQKQSQVVTCSYTWELPHVADGTLRGLRRVGDAANVREDVTGLQPNQSFNLVNQHVSGFPIFRVPVFADAQGNYFVNLDTTIIPSAYTAGDYNSFIEVNSQNVATCRGFRIQQPSVQQIDIDKTVRNERTGIGFLDSVDAKPGDIVTFRLVVNPGSSNTAQNVNVRDILPSGLIYVSGSLKLESNPVSLDNFFGSGKDFGILNPGSQMTITFQSTVGSATSLGLTEGFCTVPALSNTAIVTSVGGTDSDNAFVRVCVDVVQKQPGTPAPRPTT